MREVSFKTIALIAIRRDKYDEVASMWETIRLVNISQPEAMQRYEKPNALAKKYFPEVPGLVYPIEVWNYFLNELDV